MGFKNNITLKEIKKQLCDRVTENIVCNISNEVIMGTYFRIPFSIYYYENEGLELVADYQGALDVLVPVLSFIIGAEPLCTYKQDDDYKKDLVCEWSNKPSYRLQQILEDEDFYLDLQVNSKFLLDQNNVVKIPGIYPGLASNYLDINNIEEIYLYQALKEVFKFFMEHQVCNDLSKIYDPFVREMVYTESFLIHATSIFGVDVPKPASDKRLETTESFKKWYRKWRLKYQKYISDNPNAQENFNRCFSKQVPFKTKVLQLTPNKLVSGDK